MISIPRVVKIIESRMYDGCQGAMVGGEWGVVAEDVEFQFCKMKNSGECLHNNVNVLASSEMYS